MIIDCDQLAPWIAAVGTLLLAVIAIFQDVIRAWISKPRLVIIARTQPPCCHANVTMVQGINDVSRVDGVYLRLRISNEGNSTARGVEVFAEKLTKQQQDNSYREVTSFDPMNLMWSHIERPVMDSIPPQMHKYCGLGRIRDPQHRQLFPLEQIEGICANQTVLVFALEVQPNTKSHVVPPGNYRLLCKVGAANAKPRDFIVEINLSVTWYGREDQMLGEGVGIKIVKAGQDM